MCDPAKWKDGWSPDAAGWPAACSAAVCEVMEDAGFVPVDGQIKTPRGSTVGTKTRIDYLVDYFKPDGRCKKAYEAWSKDPTSPEAAIPAVAKARVMVGIATGQIIPTRRIKNIHAELAAHAVIAFSHDELITGLHCLSLAADAVPFVYPDASETQASLITPFTMALAAGAICPPGSLAFSRVAAAIENLNTRASSKR